MQAYISGNALIILDSPNNVLQTTYHEIEDDLIAVVLDDATGKIATCTNAIVHVYKPYGQDEGAVKVGGQRKRRAHIHWLICCLVVTTLRSVPTGCRRYHQNTIVGPRRRATRRERVADAVLHAQHG